MTTKQILADKIDSLLYWAEELKTMHTELENSEGNPNYDDISWIAYIMKHRAESVREILKEDEFKN